MSVGRRPLMQLSTASDCTGTVSLRQGKAALVEGTCSRFVDTVHKAAAGRTEGVGQHGHAQAICFGHASSGSVYTVHKAAVGMTKAD